MKKRYTAIAAAALFAALASPCTAQHLVRRSFAGFQPMPVNDSVAKAHKLPAPDGYLVTRLRPDGSLAKLGAQDGDLLLAYNNVPLHNDEDLQKALKGISEGQALTAQISRNGKKQTLTGTAAGVPREQSTPQYEVIYGEAAFQNGWLRTIVRKPRKAGKMPVIYFIPGYTCASVDGLSPIHPYTKMLDSLGKLGWAIYRIEKPGVGDGPHPCQCMDTGFDLEMEVFATGYRDLLKQPFVDPDNVFLFGHSMGGFEAPLLAEMPEFKPKGIAIYGSAFQTWYEYIIAMLRFQEPRNGEDYLQFEKDMTEYIDLFYEHYVKMKPLEEIIKNPTWKALLVRDFELNDAGDILWRKWFFWQELAKRNTTNAWAATEAYVLSIYGTADFEVFNSFSMEEIARIVNAYHPGRAKYVQLEGADHGMINVGSMDRLLELRNTPAYRDVMIKSFDYRIVTELDKWLREVSMK